MARVVLIDRLVGWKFWLIVCLVFMYVNWRK